MISLLIIGGAFTIFMVSILCIRVKWKNNRLITDYLLTAMQVIRWVGIGAILNGISILLVYPENSAFLKRATGPYAWAYWMMFLGLLILPQLYWIHKFQIAPWRWLIALGLLGTSGVLFEEFVIMVTSFHKDFGGSDALLGFVFKNLTRIASFAGVTYVIMDVKKRLHKPPNLQTDD